MQKMASITSKDAIFYSERCHLLPNERWHLLHIRDKGWMWYGLTLRLILNKHLLQEHTVFLRCTPFLLLEYPYKIR